MINEIYGFSLSHETISNIVDRVQPRVIEWQNRRLDKVYSFVYMDALMVSMKSERKAGKYAVYSMIGVNCEGKRTVLTSGSEGTREPIAGSVSSMS